MTTNVITRNSENKSLQLTVKATCCEYLKRTNASTQYDEVFTTHPSGYTAIKNAQRFFDIINEEIPYFTIKIITPAEFRKIWNIKAVSTTKHDAREFLKLVGADSPIFYIKLNWDKYPAFVNLLTPVTMTRFVLTSGEVKAANNPLEDFLDHFEKSKEKVHLPSLLWVLDNFHGYYKVTSDAFSTAKRGIVESAFREGSRQVGTVAGFFQSVATSNKWYRSNQHNSTFMSHVTAPLLNRLQELRSAMSYVKTNMIRREHKESINVVDFYKEVVKIHLKTEERLVEYHDVDKTPQSKYLLTLNRS